MIIEILSPQRKMAIARAVLEALPDWFGIEEARETYIQETQSETVFANIQGEQVNGFCALKPTSPDTLEIAVIGVQPSLHRHGIGASLIKAASQYAIANHYALLQVKTIESGYYESYDKTNRFYTSMGFKKLEVFPDLWSPHHPCQIYVLPL
ncbi:MAG TPA: GNAT family N-acetyltransferase [Candidatus Fimiplasma intestinipullorum]|uniref:GNAT family N-acetyltransferase n=1 Tax=Candidatus Fimiplasma intestinipullorum TaxID=2840825 RepID=A0A9D1HQ68_9FIRM|nr:GNAT family N-acetyltransferase [Candidatus Fimiplasma intestinipullorum]